MDVLALVAGQVLILALVLKTASKKKGPSVVDIPYQGPVPFSILRWPFTNTTAQVTLIDATLTTAFGQSNVTNWIANNESNAFQTTIEVNGSVSLSFGTAIGTLIVIGDVVVEYIRTTRQGPQRIETDASSILTSVPLNNLLSSVVLRSPFQSGSASFWFAQDPANVYDQFVMQTFLSQGQSMSLRITDLNNVFYITSLGITRKIQLQASTDLLTPLPNEANTANFFDLLQIAGICTKHLFYCYID